MGQVELQVLANARAAEASSTPSRHEAGSDDGEKGEEKWEAAQESKEEVGPRGDSGRLESSALSPVEREAVYRM